MKYLLIYKKNVLGLSSFDRIWETFTAVFDSMDEIKVFFDSHCTTMNEGNRIFKQFFDFEPVEIYEFNRQFRVKVDYKIETETKVIEHRKQDGYSIKAVEDVQ